MIHIPWFHDYVMRWRHFSNYLSLVRGLWGPLMKEALFLTTVKLTIIWDAKIVMWCDVMTHLKGYDMECLLGLPVLSNSGICHLFICLCHIVLSSGLNGLNGIYIYACACWAIFVVMLTNTVHLIYIYIYMAQSFRYFVNLPNKNICHEFAYNNTLL